MSSFKKFQLIVVIFLISISTFYGGYYLGKRGFVFELRANPPAITVENRFPKDQNVDFELFWTVWERVNSDYLLRPLDAQELVYGAIRGMVDAVGDPYTSFLPPEENETVNNSINGTYEGIGAELAIRDEQIVVVSPLDGSPAEQAGVRPGDKILAIDGETTIGMTLTQAVSKIRGDRNTKVTLTLQRDNAAPFETGITRGSITVESVTWEDKGDGTAYIRIGRFGGETNSDWAQVVSKVNVGMEQLDTIVLDVRGNPGGYLNSAVYIAEEFVKEKTILYQESSTGKQTPYNSERVGAFIDIPRIVILIDEGSASASEILTAALKENLDNVIVVGQTSFGKGTIQDAENFEDGSGIHITIAKWLTPNKGWVHDTGISPDVEVELDIEAYKEGKDTQLDKAIEIANEI